jgi:hypothetical protein
VNKSPSKKTEELRSGNVPEHFWFVNPHHFTTVVFTRLVLRIGVRDDIIKVGSYFQTQIHKKEKEMTR